MHRLFSWLLWQAILFNFLLLRITCTNCHNSSLFLTPRILILNSLFLTPSFSWSRIYFILLSAEWTHSLLTHILSQSELCEDYQHLPKHVTPKKNTRPMWTVLPQLVFLHHQVWLATAALQLCTSTAPMLSSTVCLLHLPARSPYSY